jgi:DNA-binding transcriptional LysR family regulator
VDKDGAELDLNHLATFAKVVHAESFTLAARALGVPKSTVSRRVSALEAALGVRLLRRTTRKLSLTDAGAIYFEKASRALEAIEEASAAVADMEGEPRGIVRLTTPVDLGVEIVADLLARFSVLHPKIHVDVSLSARQVDLVEEGFDLALRAGRLGDSSLIARRIGSIDSRLYASPAYVEAHGCPKKLAELAEHACVVFRPQRLVSNLEFEGPKGAEKISLRGNIGADDFSFVRRAIVAGAGIGLLPAIFCKADVADGSLVRVLPKHAVRGASLHLVYPSTRYVPQRVRILREWLLAELARVIPGDEPGSKQIAC